MKKIRFKITDKANNVYYLTIRETGDAELVNTNNIRMSYNYLTSKAAEMAFVIEDIAEGISKYGALYSFTRDEALKRLNDILPTYEIKIHYSS